MIVPSSVCIREAAMKRLIQILCGVVVVVSGSYFIEANKRHSSKSGTSRYPYIANYRIA